MHISLVFKYKENEEQDSIPIKNKKGTGIPDA